MLDLHDFAGTGDTRCFRALGATLLDISAPPATAEMLAATTAGVPTPPEGESKRFSLVVPFYAFLHRFV